MRLYSSCLLLAALAATPALASAQTLHVSEVGNDNSSGTASQPLRTVQKALSLSPQTVKVTSGQFIFNSTVAVPPGTTIVGGHVPIQEDGNTLWLKTVQPTVFLLTTSVGQPGIVLNSTSTGPGAALEDITLLGGYVSVLMNENTRLTETVVQGASEGTAQFAGVLTSEGREGRPAIIERSRFEGGNTAIRVDGTGRAVVRETLIRNTVGRGIFASGGGSLLVDRSLIVGARSDGMSIIFPVAAEVRNSAIRGSTGAGLVINEAAPLVVGSVFERNRVGVSFRFSDGALLRHNTIARNRESGLLVDNSWPDLSANIIAFNDRFGVEEISNRGADGPDTPEEIVGGALTNNILWANELGEYLDSDLTVLDTTASVNSAFNIREVSGNMVEDPLFTNIEKGNYRLQLESPGIDRVSIAGLPAVDQEGNPRIVETPGYGNSESTQVADIGAYERQSRFRTKFGAFGHDTRLTPDHLNPSNPPAFVRENERWKFNQVSFDPFTRIEADFLPGRLRLYSKGNYSFGAVVMETDEMKQPKDSVGVVKLDLDVTAGGFRTSRFRINAHPSGELATDIMLSANSNLFTGPSFRWIYDVRQGMHRQDSASPDERYDLGFYVDLLNLQDIPYQGKIDVRGIDVDFVPRAVFDAQFNKLMHRWTFESGVEGWRSASIPQWNPASFGWDPTREALRVRQTTADTFGAWYSPPFVAQPGTDIRVDIRVSASTDDLANIQGFRFRASPSYFGFAQSILVLGSPNGPSSPGIQSRTYSLYVSLPPTLDPTEEISLYFDLWGFGPRRDCTLYLEEVAVFGIE